MRKRWIALVLALLLLLGANALSESPFTTSIVQYEYGDPFAAPLCDINGDEALLPEMPTLLICLSPGCSNCLTLISQLQPMLEVLGDAYVQTRIIWRNYIPQGAIEACGLPISMNLASQETAFAAQWPTFYMVDAEGKVRYRGNDMMEAVEKLLSLQYFPEGYLAARADQYLLSQMEAQDEKIPLLYFHSTGCSDCARADEALQNDPRIGERFSLKKLYGYNERDPEKWMDHFGLLAMVYGVTWYPSFLILNEGASVLVGETPVDMLCETLMHTIE